MDRIHLNGYMKELLGLTGRSLSGWHSSARTGLSNAP
jgi:hypothetical protein